MSEVSSMAFGGDWSGKKLDVLSEYLSSYTQALKNTPFKLAYIDAFAGSGIRQVPSRSSDDWFDIKIAADEENYRHGSPLIALATKPSFDSFIFVEQDAKSIERLKSQVEENFAHLADKVIYKQGDANELLIHISTKNWKGHRAVAFLDPFALDVSWETIEIIAKTKSIDMWLLFPAMAVNRMLARDGNISSAWAEKLSKTLAAITGKRLSTFRNHQIF